MGTGIQGWSGIGYINENRNFSSVLKVTAVVGWGDKCGDFKDGKLTEYHNFLSSSYRGLYFSTLQCISLQH